MWDGGETPHQKRASLAGQQIDWSQQLIELHTVSSYARYTT